ncbi:MAG: nucleoside triphosphate pyrophosphatase [Gammaproteobacteria bacterium]
MIELILASSSSARKALMERLNTPFKCYSPNIDEIPLPDETHTQYVLRLSEEKAVAIGVKHPNALTIGSDAIASLNGKILGKPLDHETAVSQLTEMSGQTVHFLTGVCVYHGATQQVLTDIVLTKVTFRTLSPERIEYYLKTAKPYGSAGSLHSEGLGILLMERWEGDDPTALMGLPMIRLTEYLETMGFEFG